MISDRICKLQQPSLLRLIFDVVVWFLHLPPKQERSTEHLCGDPWYAVSITKVILDYCGLVQELSSECCRVAWLFPGGGFFKCVLRSVPVGCLHTRKQGKRYAPHFMVRACFGQEGGGRRYSCARRLSLV